MFRPRLIAKEHRGSPGGKEEGENVAKAVSPSVLVVDTADNSLIDKIATRLPAAFGKDAEELVGVTDMMGTFRGANIEPYEELRSGRGAAGETKDATAIPPDRWG